MTTPKTALPLPCPFCGTAADVADTGTCWVRCNNHECCAEGPLADDEHIATEKWNTRAPAQCGVQSREAIAAVIDPVAFHPISLGDTHPGWLHRREVALETAGKILALGPAQQVTVTDEMAMAGAKAMILLGREHRIRGEDLPSRQQEARACLDAALALSSADRGRDNG